MQSVQLLQYCLDAGVRSECEEGDKNLLPVKATDDELQGYIGAHLTASPVVAAYVASDPDWRTRRGKYKHGSNPFSNAQKLALAACRDELQDRLRWNDGLAVVAVQCNSLLCLKHLRLDRLKLFGDDCSDKVWTGSVAKRLSAAAASRGSIDIMQWLHRKGKLTEEAHSQRFGYDSNDGLPWGINLSLYSFAAESGSIDALRWLKQHTRWDNYEHQYSCVYAAAAGSAHCLQWLLRHGEVTYLLNLDELVRESAKSKDLYTMRVALDYALDASYENGPTGNSRQVKDLVNKMQKTACETGHIQALQWLRDEHNTGPLTDVWSKWSWPFEIFKFAIETGGSWGTKGWCSSRKIGMTPEQFEWCHKMGCPCTCRKEASA